MTKMLSDLDIEEVINCLEYEEYPEYSKSIEENLYIPESKSNYSFWRTPYFKDICNLIDNPEIKQISLMIPSQIGKSQLLTALSLEFARRNPGILVLYYTPDEQSAKNYANEKLLPCAINSPIYEQAIRRCDNGNIDRSSFTKNSIEFINGSKIMALGAGGKTSLVSKTSPFIVLDEYARMKSLSKNAGDILSMAHTRTTQFSYSNSKVIAVSTPLEEKETIHKAHLESRQYSWEVPCPCCGKFQRLEFQNMKWNKPIGQEIDMVTLANKITSGEILCYYLFPCCETILQEKDKLNVINKGRMVCTGNEHLSNEKISLHLNGLYSMAKWSQLIGRFLYAQNDLLKMQEFKNQVLAEPWAEEARTKKLIAESLPRGEYPRTIIPPNTYRIVSGVDCQDNRYYAVELAYTRDKKIYLIDWSETKFDPEFAFNPESYPVKIQTKDFDGQTIDMMAIDTGGHYTKLIYDLCDDLPKAQKIKGQPRHSNPIVYSTISKTSPDLMLCYLQNTNTLLNSLIDSKQFLIPANISPDDELLSHMTNVVYKKGKWQDRTTVCRVDFRDAIRYALTWIYFADYSTELDKEIYYEQNKKQIEEQRAANRLRLSNIF